MYVSCMLDTCLFLRTKIIVLMWSVIVPASMKVLAQHPLSNSSVCERGVHRWPMHLLLVPRLKAGKYIFTQPLFCVPVCEFFSFPAWHAYVHTRDCYITERNGDGLSPASLPCEVDFRAAVWLAQLLQDTCPMASSPHTRPSCPCL